MHETQPGRKQEEQRGETKKAIQIKQGYKNTINLSLCYNLDGGKYEYRTTFRQLRCISKKGEMERKYKNEKSGPVPT